MTYFLISVEVLERIIRQQPAVPEDPLCFENIMKNLYNIIATTL